MKTTSILSALSALVMMGSVASAQSPLYALDVRIQRFIKTDTAAFVANMVVIGPNTNPVFALDFEQTATTLWGVHNTTLQTGTFDLTTGAFNAVGVVTGPTVGSGATGLTCSPTGTWFLSQFVAATGVTSLYTGDVTTGTFTLVGPIATAIVIDIAIDSQGNMYGHNISTDVLMSIDTTTGLGTTIGPTGQLANFAQGMDFDWSTDTLYAHVYISGGNANFCNFNLTTGAAENLQPTITTNGEFEISIQVASNCPAPFTYCTAKPNSQNGVLPGCPNGILAIGGSGISSATAASGFTISAVNSLNNKIGILIYKNSIAGSAMGAQPFAGGTLCLASGLGPNRSTPVNSGGTPAPANDCSGIYAIDMNTFARGLIPGPPVPQAYLSIVGQEVVAQFWGRDPGFAPPNNVQLSDGLHFTVCQ